MPIKLDTTIGQVGQSFAQGLRVGYTPQINPSPFVRAYDSTIRAGQQLQGLGEMGAEFASQQAAIANDNLVNKQLLEFEREKGILLNQVKTDVNFRDKTPTGQFGSYVENQLKNKQTTLLQSLPPIRKSSFIANTAKSILQAKVAATSEGVNLNNSEYKTNALKLRKDTMNAIANPQEGFDYETARNGYVGFIANGVRARVYEPDEGERLSESFDDAAALTLLDREELVLTNGEEVEPEMIDQHLEKIRKSPLDPKDKTPRTESFLNSLAILERRRQTENTRLKKEVEDTAFSDYYMRLPNPDKLYQDDDVFTLVELQGAIDVGIISDPGRIKDLRELLLKQEKLQYYPDGFDVVDATTNSWENIKSIVLDQSVFREDAEALLNAFYKQVDEMHQLVPLDLSTEDANTLLKDISQFRTKIRNDKFLAEEKRIDSAKKEIRFLIKGDPFDKQYTLVSPSIVTDAQKTAALLIRSGVRPDLAIEDAMDLVNRNTSGFSTDFYAKRAETMVIQKYKESSRSLTDNDRELLRRIIKRRQKSEGKPKISAEERLRQAEQKAQQQ